MSLKNIATNDPQLDEQICWRCTIDELPDDDQTVMIYAPDADEPVWLGWLEHGEGWRAVDGGPIDVTFWAPMPGGPTF